MVLSLLFLQLCMNVGPIKEGYEGRIRCKNFHKDGDTRMDKGMNWSVTNTVKNKMTKIVNGNIKSTIKITHWNPGSRHWVRKSVEIQQVLDTRRPDIMIISEANIFKEDDDYKLWTPGYTMIRMKSLQTLGVSRLAVLIKEGMQVKVMEEWMDPNIASAWLKIIKNGKKMFVGGYTENTQY